MVTAVSSGIRISISPRYEPDYSEPAAWNHYFSYRIEIENLNDYPVQLLEREWIIFDCVGERRLVQGAGVVGETPIIQSGETYSYASGCDLKGLLGFMEGKYIMKGQGKDQEFKVDIPRFNLEAPSALN